MKTLYLIRHGLTRGLQEHLYYGATDLPLLPEGEEELRRLSAAGGYPSPEYCRVVTTGMLRTEQSLRCLYGEVPHDTEPLLREINFGIFEMRSHEEIQDLPEYQAWMNAERFFSAAPPGGESWDMMEQRLREGLAHLCREERDTILICHGGTIIILMSILFPGEKENPYTWQPPAGCGYSVDLEEKSYSYIPKPWITQKKV